MAQLLDFGAAWALPLPLPLRPPNMAQEWMEGGFFAGFFAELMGHDWDMVRSVRSDSDCEKLQDHEVAEPMEAGELGFCDLGLEKESLEGAANLVMLLLPLLNMLTKCAEMPRLGLLGLLKLQDISGTSSHGFQLFASHASHASHEQLL